MSRTLILGALLAASVPGMAATRGMSAEDLVMFDRVSAPQISPDGKRLTYLLRKTDRAANKGVTSLWIRNLEGGKPRRLSDGKVSVASPTWSVDGNALFFLSAKSGSQQIWRLDLGGGEAQQVTDFAVDVGGYRFSPDGSRIAVSLEVYDDCTDLACTANRLSAPKTASGVGYDRLFIRHWDTWSDGRRSQLFVAKLDEEGRAGNEPVRLTRGIDGDVPSKPFGDESEFSWSPDGSRIAFNVRIAGRNEAWSTNFDIYEVAADGTTLPRNLTASNPAWDAGPVYSADGKTLFYRAMRRAGFEADRFALMRLDLQTEAVSEVAPGWDRSADGITLSADGKTIYTLADDLGEHRLFAIDVEHGLARRVVSGGAVAEFDLNGDALVFARHRLDTPAQLFRAASDGSDATQISSFNRARLDEIAMGEFEQFSFAGWNDETVHGYVVKPWNYQKGRKYPVAFIIHGGPQGSMGNSFHYRWNPQTYAGQGWAVVFIDFHGSTGYGQSFTDSISGDWGGKPLQDLQKGWAAALDKYAFLDGGHACALGASYGGYMVNWIAGNWSAPWKCLVTHSGVFDNRMMGYATEELWFDEWEMQGTPYEKPANYERHNPVNHVAQWRVPMLVVHGQLDYRIPVEQGIGAFTALQRRGIPSRFVYFPDENHWILKPANSLQWHDEVNSWLKLYLEPR
ncbi:MAG: S9 family peptidase [Xanthomonadales bacterium]|nr:S9 family peptidase [Xanthomonadales bacterium]